MNLYLGSPNMANVFLLAPAGVEVININIAATKANVRYITKCHRYV